MKQSLFSWALLAAAGVAQAPGPAAEDANVASSLKERAWSVGQVVHERAADGRLWAAGATWKASFGRDGFVYVPALGRAPRNFPLQLRLLQLRAGGQPVPFDANALPVRDGDRVVFERGAVREVYDLALSQVEQTFVVDTTVHGDVELELAAASDLAEDAATAGLNFRCAFGGVDYGDAFVVRDGERVAIESTFDGGRIRLHVPAVLWGDGPLVIDPILSTQAATVPNVLTSPDVAYDATNQRYLMVWEQVFSEFDHDVLSLMFDAQGNVIAGSAAPIDITTAYVEHPRVADLNEADRFLVVASVLDAGAGGRMMIQGRMRDAGGTTALHPWVPLSDPAIPGNNYLPEIGTDPGTGAGNHDWLVVWANQTGATQSDIQGRLVRGDGQPRTPIVQPIHSVPGQYNWDLQISHGNGNGSVAHPQWWVVYRRTSPGTAGDVFGRAVYPNGTVDAEMQFATSTDDEKLPRVSSPVDIAAGVTTFFVTYERPAMPAIGKHYRILANGTLVVQIYDLSASFNAGRYTPSVDTDGIRFVFSSSLVNPNSTLPDYTSARTLAFDNGQLVQQDWQTVTGVVSETRVVAQASSGGPAGGYALAYMCLVNGQKQPMLTRYSGRTPGAEHDVLATACGGVGIAVTGSTAIGSALQFSLSGFGADIPAFGFGGANQNAVPICPVCSLGLRIDMPILVFAGATMGIAIPPSLSLIGETYAMQGITIGSGTCLGSLHFSDTIRFTIR